MWFADIIERVDDGHHELVQPTEAEPRLELEAATAQVQRIEVADSPPDGFIQQRCLADTRLPGDDQRAAVPNRLSEEVRQLVELTLSAAELPCRI
ncbi:hypothetical protein ATC03_10930 [Agromyces aureus]|uniref:Uncharacterized protein n=1 Tax=Agromyces aureus TaxID=453304 RepID=A0A191WG10_9MICO|nr:hypothetical protein ATC03_10930 [Agromyces aureus]